MSHLKISGRPLLFHSSQFGNHCLIWLWRCKFRLAWEDMNQRADYCMNRQSSVTFFPTHDFLYRMKYIQKSCMCFRWYDKNLTTTSSNLLLRNDHLARGSIIGIWDRMIQNANCTHNLSQKSENTGWKYLSAIPRVKISHSTIVSYSF